MLIWWAIQIVFEMLINLPGWVENSHESVTMMACIDPAGTAIPPMFIVKEQTKQTLSSFKTCDVRDSSQFMCGNIMPGWKIPMHRVSPVIQRYFLKDVGMGRLQLLILDWHAQNGIEILIEAKANEVIILMFSSATTHFLHPLSHAVFSPFQEPYNTICSNYMAADSGHQVKKSTVWISWFTVTTSAYFLDSINIHQIIYTYKFCVLIYNLGTGVFLERI